MKDLHRRWVANHLRSKIRELRFFLELVVDGSTQSRNAFKARQQEPQGAAERVVCGFSGFSNALQSLKDSFETATGEPLAWSTLSTLRHGAFVKDARNAATHDGNPIVNGWVDGEYYTLGKIVRIDRQDKIINIEPPIAPIYQVCAEFAQDLCALLAPRLASHCGRDDLRGMVFTEEMLEGFFGSPQIPDFAKELFRNDKDRSLALIAKSDHDPILSALEELIKVEGCCALVLSQ